MGLEYVIFSKAQQLSEQQCQAVLKYMNCLLISSQRSQLFPQTTVEEGVGCVNYKGQKKSLEEIQHGIEIAVQQQWQRENS